MDVDLSAFIAGNNAESFIVIKPFNNACFEKFHADGLSWRKQIEIPFPGQSLIVNRNNLSLHH